MKMDEEDDDLALAHAHTRSSHYFGTSTVSMLTLFLTTDGGGSENLSGERGGGEGGRGKGGHYSFPCLPSFYLLMAIVLLPFVVNSSRQREDQGEVITNLDADCCLVAT